MHIRAKSVNSPWIASFVSKLHVAHCEIHYVKRCVIFPSRRLENFLCDSRSTVVVLSMEINDDQDDIKPTIEVDDSSNGRSLYTD